MNENRISQIMNRLFHIIFLVFLGATFLGVISSFLLNENQDTTAPGILIMLVFVPLTAVAALLYDYTTYTAKSSGRLKKSTPLSDKQATLIIVAGAFIILLVQLYVGYLLRNHPVTDVNIINKYIYDFAKTGNFDLIQSDYSKGFVYLIRYPNNFAITIFMSFVCRLGYLIFGYVPKFLPVAVNSIAINCGILFTALIAQKLFGNKKAFFTLGMCALFPPFYTFTAFCYTDTLSLPFMAGGIYFFLLALKSHKKIKPYVFAVICGIIVFLGFKMKASVIFVIIIAVIYGLLKLDLKRFATLTLALIIGFTGAATLYNTAFNSMHLATKEQFNESQYPYTHWVMMGLKGKGCYHLSDSNYTASFPDIQEKTQGNIKEIKRRIDEKGLGGLYSHISQKVVWTWSDGTYFISHHIEKPVKNNILHSFVLNRGKYHNIFSAYSNGFHLMLLFFMLMSIIKGIKNPKPTFTTLLKGLVFAIFIFLIIWETRSRYLYNFTPVFILLSVDGIDYFLYLLKKLTESFKNKFAPAK
ncbi:MAG: glycosyltransferase family 39 protein [Ruminococcus sp.]